MSEPRSLLRVDGKRAVPAIMVAAAFGLLAVLSSLRSYSRSDSLTLLDSRVATDEGLLSLRLPLTRLAVGERPEVSVMTFERDEIRWTAGPKRKTPLRAWMASQGPKSEGGMIAGFGYWKGTWQSDSRPGPFIVVFAPIWAAFVACYVIFVFFYFSRRRFTIRFMLIATATVAGMLGLLMLRSPG